MCCPGIRRFWKGIWKHMLSTSVGATEDVSEHVDSHVGAVLFNGITSNNGLFDVSI
jgi:hypothetical protein